jgi:hypothetical protein
MRPYIGFTAAIILAAACLALGTAQTPPRILTREQAREEARYFDWLRHRMDEAYSIHVGMSRADLLKVFNIDGGLQRIPPRRYSLPRCDMIKVDVEFELPQGASRNKLPADNELKISAISKPYLERSIPE